MAPEHLNLGVLIRQAHGEFAAAGVPISTSRLTRLVKAWQASVDSEKDFGAWVLTYRDPTGETAVWNVLKQSKKRTHSTESPPGTACSVATDEGER